MTASALLAIAALGAALTLAGCRSDALDGPGGRPVALTVAVPAPLRGELAAIVHSIDARATVVALSAQPGPAPATDVVLAIAATDFVAHPGLMAPGFHDDSFLGKFASSVVAFGVAPGNPHGIHDWGDLMRPGVRAAITDPDGADGGRLEVLSAATAIVVRRHHNRFARDYVRRLLTRAAVAPTEAAAVTRFATGGADAVVTTEDRLLAARDRGVALDIVYPPTPVPVVVAIGVGSRSAHPKAAQALVDALRQPGPQKALARDGLRPVLVGYAPPDRFPALSATHTPAILGTPALVARSYFGPKGVVTLTRAGR
jgi:ABC-type sulfate transport system substrate-binding protein